MDASANARHWNRALAIAFVCGIALAAGYVFTVSDPFYFDYYPVRALKRNRTRVNEYVRNLYRGNIPKREDGQGYYILDVLADCDARYVRIDNECVFITFPFLPTDAIPALIYSPNGLDGLPRGFKPGSVDNDGQPSLRLHDFTQIDDNWFYMRYDSS